MEQQNVCVQQKLICFWPANKGVSSIILHGKCALVDEPKVDPLVLQAHAEHGSAHGRQNLLLSFKLVAP